MPSLYAKYIAEREGKLILETDEGFATYKFFEKLSTVYIEEVFVLPEFRQTGIGAAFVDKISEIAQDAGYEKLLTSVCPAAKDSTTSLKAVLACGFELDSLSESLIYLSKPIRNKNGKSS